MYAPLQQQIPIGDLDQRISFEQDTGSLIQGEKKEIWTAIATVWANVEENTGNESGQLERETAFGKITITVRYNASFTDEAFRVLWQGDYYNVFHVAKTARNRFMIIQAQRVK